MEPAIQAGQQFFVSRTSKPQPGDVVVIKHPQKKMFLVKRVKEELENGEFLVAGDNPEHSEDSRNFGAVKKEQIVGKLSFRYWPLKKIGFLKQS